MGCAGSSTASTLAPGDASPPRAISDASDGLKPINLAPAPAPRAVERHLTSRSQAMQETLEGLETELHEMQETSERAEQLLGQPELPVGLRSELATMHGAANKLLATRLDAIVTSDLTTGRDAARAKRKVLVAATEALIEKTEQQIQLIDQRKEAALAASGTDV